jgi:GT2 family glycosyltransferase
MRISVLIVNYNGGHLLHTCVASALAAGATQVLVADNASHDNSIAQLHTHIDDPRVQVTLFSHNLGFAAAANRLLPQAEGELLLFLNPDCLLPPQALRLFTEVMQAHPCAGMAGPVVYGSDGTIEAACRRRVPTPGRSLARLLRLPRIFPHYAWAQGFEYDNHHLPTHVEVVEGISGACMCVRRTALMQVGSLAEDYFLHCEDLDWFMRMRAGGWEILFVPTIEVIHHQGTCSRTQPLRVLWYKHRGMLIFYRKFFRQHYPLPLLWAVSSAVYIRFAVLALKIGLQRLKF